MIERNRLLYLLLRAASRALPRIPAQIAYRLAVAAGTLAYFLVPRARRNIQANLAVVLGEASSSALVRSRARDAFCNDAKNWVDTLRIGSIGADDIARSLRVHGWEHLDRALQGGRGVILVAMHLGNFDLVGQLIATRGLDLTVPVERMEPPELFEFLTQGRRSKGIHLVPVDRAPWALLASLRRGKLIGILADRDLAGHGIEVRFFGRPALLPGGPAALARRTGAPLLLAYAVRLPDNSFLGFIHPPLPIEHTGDGDEDDRRNTQHLAHLMEPIIRRYAGQWLQFAPVWCEAASENRPGAIMAGAGAAM